MNWLCGSFENTSPGGNESWEASDMFPGGGLGGIGGPTLINWLHSSIGDWSHGEKRILRSCKSVS
jgi:hypothetical protein